VVAAPRLVNVFDLRTHPGQLLEPCDRFEDGHRVCPTAPDVLDSRGTRAFLECEHGCADIRRVEVVPHLLSLVTVDPVRPSRPNATAQIGEETVEFGTGMVRARQASAPKADGRHREVTAVLLDEQIGGGFRRPEQGVEGRIDPAPLVDARTERLVGVVIPGLVLVQL
jgi:hypothetical protein